MRIFPFVLIAIGVVGVLRHYGYIDPAFLHLLWPLLLIGIGIALLARGPRWRAGMHERMHDRWERRIHRHFGPGWASLSDEERDRFRAGMRQHGPHVHGGGRGSAAASAPANDGSSPQVSGGLPAPGEQR